MVGVTAGEHSNSATDHDSHSPSDQSASARLDRRADRRTPGSSRLRGAPAYRRVDHTLGIKVAASTVWEILNQEGIDPTPDRTSTTWAAFLRSQAAMSTNMPLDLHGRDFRQALAGADKKGPLYEALGITITYEHVKRAATVRSRPSSPYRQWLCPRGDLNPHAR